MTTGKSGSAKVTVRIDRALRRRWLDALRVVRRSARGAAVSFDERWEAVAEILDHDPPLYLAGGFATAREFLAAELGETERTARRYVRVARFASPVEEARYGVSKLDAVLAFLEARAGKPFGRLPVDFQRLRIPVRRDERPRRLTVASASVEEVRSATRALLRSSGGAAPGTAPLVRAVDAALAAGPLRGIRVRLAAGRLSFSGVPADALAAFAAALAGVRLPDPPA